MAYSEKVIDHFENPRNVGSLDKNDPNVGTGLVGAPACGDVMKLQLRISDDGVGIRNQDGKAAGLGFRIMRYRADLIRATWAVGPGARGGTLVSCTLNEETTHAQK